MKLANEAEDVAVVTGSRADFGLLANVCSLIDQDARVKLTVIVTGSHLSKHHGYTLNEVTDRNYKRIEFIDLHIDGDSRHDINRYISISVIKFSELFRNSGITRILVLGDRYEIFGACIAASILGIKVAHIHGGEVTAGAFDEFMRHSITKMASLHFTCHDEYSKRVRRLGENPATIFNVGGLGAENVELYKKSLLSKTECESRINFKFKLKNLMITFHPETNNKESIFDLDELLAALAGLRDTAMFFSLPNADNGFSGFSNKIHQFVNERPDTACAFSSLGQKVYFSVLQFVDAVVGNSSSGLLEAPSFNVATVNIGERQRGRVKAKTVINTQSDRLQISNALEKVFSEDSKKNISNISNPFYRAGTSEEIARIFIEYKFSKDPKMFCD